MTHTDVRFSDSKRGPVWRRPLVSLSKIMSFQSAVRSLKPLAARVDTKG